MSQSVLKETLQKQIELSDQNEQVDEKSELTPSLIFNLRGESFTCRLEDVKEVVEVTSITPYPIMKRGHLGLVNLRGKVTPVLCPLFSEETRLKTYEESEFKKLNDDKYRLIVFQEDDEEDFAIIACDVAKRMSLSEQWDEQNVIKMDGHPYKIFNSEEVKQTYRELK